MSEKRFILKRSNAISSNYCLGERVYDTVLKKELYNLEIVDLLNEQQDTIITLKRRLEKINGGYGHLTYRNGLTANEWLIESQERELKKKNEQISDLKEENEQMRKELDCFHPVMFQDMRKGTVVLYLKELK